MPIGFVLGFIPTERVSAYVHYLFVDEAYRQQGIGRRLMESFIDAVYKFGAKEVVLFTRQAVNFYQKLGFKLENSIFAPELVKYAECYKGVKIMKVNL
jgi:ribosomal protein S18 acetylase RimI-like enzyme